jgi:MscS family membrane protein
MSVQFPPFEPLGPELPGPLKPDEHTVSEIVTNLGLETTIHRTGWVDWGMLLLAITLGVVGGKIASMIVRRLGKTVETRNWWKTRGIGLRSAAGPVHLALITLGLKAGLTWIILSPFVRAFTNDVIHLLWIVALAWYLYNLVDLVELGLRRVVRRTKSTLDDQVVPLVRKSLRLFLIVVFALFTAENVFGADITAWLAGLGIAGLAVSLAAQDSIKNLFGSLTILLDRPFATGEAIHFDGQEGPVEVIGFRSTKIRTADGELVTIPNSKIVDGSVKNIGRRPYIRRVFELAIAADTPVEKVEEALSIVKGLLAEPEVASAFDVEKNPPRVALETLATDALKIKVFYWHTPPDYWAYLAHVERVNLELLRRFKAAGIEFAFPSRTMFLAGDPRRGLNVQVANALGSPPGNGNPGRDEND